MNAYTAVAAQPGLGPVGRVCTVTVMDESDPDIRFDADGACHYVAEYREVVASMPQGEVRDAAFARTVEAIKAAGRGKDYDCILGLSGGVDSSYLAWLAKQHGLRPLVVHFDNGWNNELAVANIESIVSRLGFDLHTYVMDWREFRDLQRSYFKASVLDLEVPTDHMIFGALYETATRHNIKYILSGNNVVTEWLLPKSWYYSKFDMVNIEAIQRRFGTMKLDKLPRLGLWSHARYQLVRGIVDAKLLDLVDYEKRAAKQLLMGELGWRDYGGKHYESIFTRFYQGYILPRKWGIDKRKAHLSNLILAGSMRRADALAELAQPTYDPDVQRQDKVYVATKLGWSDDEFEAILNLPNVAHEEYGTDRADRARYFKLMRAAKPVTRVVKKLRRA